MPLRLTAAGFEYRNQAEIMQELRASVQTATLSDGTTPAFGPNFNTEPDAIGGQFLNVFAEQLAQTDEVLAQVYASIGPGAEGVTLDGVMRIAGLDRNDLVRSTVPVVLTADVLGGTVPKGTVFATADTNARFVLDADVVLAPSGTAPGTATAQAEGAIPAVAGSLTVIVTAQPGLASVTNPSDAAVGHAVEADDELLARHETSLALAGQRSLDAVVAAVEAVDGVTAAKGYQNVTALDDVDGLPGKAIELVVTGGEDLAVQRAIALAKAEGVQAWGNTTATIDDEPVGFTRPVNLEVYYAVTTTPSATSGEQAAVKAALVAFTAKQPAGATLPQFRALGVVAALLPAKTGIVVTQGLQADLSDQAEVTLQAARGEKPHTIAAHVTVA